jgi:hypothetical protein
MMCHMTTTSTCQINQLHCENCGSTYPEDVENLRDTEGYTRCCNELTATKHDCRNHHADV